MNITLTTLYFSKVILLFIQCFHRDIRMSTLTLIYHWKCETIVFSLFCKKKKILYTDSIRKVSLNSVRIFIFLGE